MIYRVSLVLEALLIIKCIHDLYGEKLKLRTELIIFMACDLILMECVYQGHLPGWCSSLIYVMLIAYCFVAFKSGIKQLIVNLVLAIVMLSVLQAICFCVVHSCISAYFGANIIVLFTYLLMILVYMVLSVWLKMNRISRFFQHKYVLASVCMVIISAIVIACILIARVDMVMYGLMYALIAICVIVICIMAFGWFRNREKAISTEAQLNAYTLYGKSYENLIMEMRARQHEFDNHLNAIYSLHRVHKDYDSLVKHQKEYCKDVSENQKYAKLLRLSNTSMAGFLYAKFIEAERNGITVEYDIKTSLVLEGIPEYKVVEVMGNLINNAMDALKDSVDKRMSVRMYKEDDKDVIVIENVGAYIQPTVFNEMFQKGYSSKGENRGIGLYSIKQMSEEYDFKIMCSNEEYEGINWISFRIEKMCGKGAV